MGKVHLFVEYRNEDTNETDYAVMLVGVVRGEYLYALRVTSENTRPEDDYVKVKLSDLTQDNPWREWEQKSIVVPSDLGMNDPRIISLKTEQLLSNLRSELDYLAGICWE